MKNAHFLPKVQLICFMAILTLVCCQKQESPTPPTPPPAPADPSLQYAVKYTHKMGGMRHWQHWLTKWPNDTLVLFADTVAEITIINDTTIEIPLGGTLRLVTASDHQLTFDHTVQPNKYYEPGYSYIAYYFPSIDSIYLFHLHSFSPYPTKEYFTTKR